MGTDNIPKRNTQLNLADIGEQTKVKIPTPKKQAEVIAPKPKEKPAEVKGKKGATKNGSNGTAKPPVTKKPDIKCKPKNFVQALIQARDEIGRVGKNRDGYDGRYTYASLDQLFVHVAPALSRAGLFLTQSCKSVELTKKRTITTTKKNPDGRDETTWTVVEEITGYSVDVTTMIMWEGGKETLVNTGEKNWSKSGKPQDLGSCETYAKRYDLLSILGVFPSEAKDIRDDDGQRVQNL